MDLTPRQRQVYELRHSTDPPMPYSAIGRELNISRETAKQAMARAELKLERVDYGKQEHDQSERRLEYRDPEKAAAVIDSLTTPLQDNMAQTARDCGVSKDVAGSMKARLERDYQPFYEEVKELKGSVLKKAFDRLAIAAIETIDQEKLDKMNAYQLTLIGAISTEKSLLLSGQPTQRISVEHRHELHQMMPQLMVEASRRGLLAEVNPDTNRAVLIDPAENPVQARHERDHAEILDAQVID